jgi:hypothetical protein
MSDLTDFQKNILTNVEKHGWFATTVFDPEGKNPTFTYSIGFSKTLGAPEFIVFGLNNDLMHDMLWEVFHQIKAGAVPKSDMRWSNLIEGFDCVTQKAVHSELHKEYTASANWFWRHQGNSGHPEVYQLVWPGAQQGLFPWEEGCDSYVISQQTQLWAD